MSNAEMLKFSGTIHINSNGDRLADFQLFQFKPDIGELVLVQQFHGQKRSIMPVAGQQIFWKYGKWSQFEYYHGLVGVTKYGTVKVSHTVW